MIIRSIKLLTLSGILILSVSSCMKDDSEAQIAEETRILNNYILSNNITVQPTESGLYYIETLAGTGDSAKVGKWMEIKYTGRLIYNNSVVMTSEKQVAVDNGLYVDKVYYGPTRLILGYISYAGLNQGIAKMREGGKSRLIFPSDLALGGQSTALIPAYSSFVFDVELVNVIPDPRSFETGLMMEYLQSKELSTDSTATGIYFTETVEGDGENPVDGDVVTVTYTGKFLNGNVFDATGTGKSFGFTLGTNAVIPGFENGVKMLRKNASATVVIPYYHAYGDYGRFDNYYRNVIPPFTTLVFDLNLTNIVKD